MAQRGYAICTQPRSGSNLLCQYLSSTRQLGNPLEYFNGPARRALGMPDFPDDPRLQIDAILRDGATPNGVYAVKLFASHLADVSKKVRWVSQLPNLRFVYLTREDLLGQAISWARAVQTGQYRPTQQAKRPAVYDPRQIATRLRGILLERAHWEAYFARTGIQPLRIVYERFLEDRLAHVRQVASLMEIAPPVQVNEEKIDLVVQRDSLSEEWRRKFQAEHGDPNVLNAGLWRQR